MVKLSLDEFMVQLHLPKVSHECGPPSSQPGANPITVGEKVAGPTPHGSGGRNRKYQESQGEEPQRWRNGSILS